MPLSGVVNYSGILLLSLMLLVGASPAAGAATPCVEDGMPAVMPKVRLKEIASALVQPVHLTHAGDGSGRLYVVEQRGTIRLMAKRKLLATPFLDIRDRVTAGGEKGLLSVAFHPQYRANGYFYVNYTTRKRGQLYTIISRFSRKSASQADPASELVLLKIEQPYDNHNGGQIAFGPDGYLYIGMGDGGSANDPKGHGQNTETLLGDLLRIDVDHEQEGRPYAVPADNPFVDKPGYQAEIWASGLRNPWRFSFDALTSQLWLADVGQDEVEEIDIIAKGGNYGWNVVEGDQCTPDVSESCNRSHYQSPIYTYRHPLGFSIVGGYVYRGQAMPELCGAYVYADYVTKRLWALRYSHQEGEVYGHRELLKAADNISSFGQDEALELYVLGHRNGKVYKLVPVAKPAPPPGSQ